jgi:hypothetical protein
MRRGLSEVYAYYSDTEAMLANVLRDVQLDPRGQESMVMLYQHWGKMRDTIAEAFGASGEHREELLGAVTLDFQTWRTFVRGQGLEQERAVGLMVGMVRCLMRS